MLVVARHYQHPGDHLFVFSAIQIMGSPSDLFGGAGEWEGEEIPDVLLGVVVGHVGRQGGV